MLSKSIFPDSKSWPALPAYALFFVILVVPGIPALLYFRVILLAVILATVGVVMVKTGRTGLHPGITLWTYSLSTLSFLFVLEGFFAGTPGAATQISIYVIWPILYVLMIAGLRNQRILVGLIRTLIVSIICIAIYSIVYMLIETSVLPESSFFDLMSYWYPQEFFLHEGYIKMTYPGLNSLLFLVPFSLAALVTCPRRVAGALSLRRAWLWTAAFCGLTSVLLAGRRALYLVTLTAPLLTLLFLSFQPMVERRLSKKALVRVTAIGVLGMLLSLSCLHSIYGVSLSVMAGNLSVGFDFSPSGSETERVEQYHALLAGWMENPILGAGHGAPAYGSIRSEESPWNYELYYLAFLYQTGLVGFAAYAAGIFWIYWMGVRMIRAGGQLSALMVACLVGMSSSLVANATNPYFGGFDTMWPIFLPLALINFWLLRRGATQPSTFA